MAIEKEELTVTFIEARDSANGFHRVYFSRTALRPDGAKKRWTGSAIVEDPNLAGRLANVAKHTEIVIQIETDWNAEDLPVFLREFRETSNSTAKRGTRTAKPVNTGKLAIR